MSESTTPDGGLRYVLDRDLCAGHGRCYALAPESFESDEVGYGLVKDVVHPAERLAAMEAVAMACPEEAIVVESVDA